MFWRRMSSPPRTREREEERHLSIRTLVIASIASATAALVTSQFWAGGTPFAAAVTPVIVTLVSELLHRPTQAIARRVTVERTAILPEAGAAAPPALVPGRAYAYVLAGNGLWKLAANRHVACLIPVARCRVAGLPPLAARVQLCCGRLPGHLATDAGGLDEFGPAFAIGLPLRQALRLLGITVCEGRRRFTADEQGAEKVQLCAVGFVAPHPLQFCGDAPKPEAKHPGSWV